MTKTPRSIQSRVRTRCIGVLIGLSLAQPSRAADDLSKPIVVSPDGRFLQQPHGAPFFWLGDTAWELFHRLDRAEANRYLKDRAEKGFTVIQAVATGKVDLIGLDAPNRYGELPFIERDPSRPNERYFAHVDWVIERARRYGLRVALLPVWGQLFVSGGGQAQVFAATNADVYGRWLGKRYRGKGVIWVLGGDVMPLWPAGGLGVGATNYMSLVDYRPVYDAMAAGIAAGEGGDPLITYHPTVVSLLGAALPRTSLYLGDRGWLDMNMLQSGHGQAGPGREQGGDRVAYSFQWNATFNYLPISAEYGSNPVRPVIDGEPSYEGHPIWGAPSAGKPSQAIGVWKPHHIRNSLYQALFAGAAGHTYGHFSVWDFHDSTLKGRLVGAYDKELEKYNRASWEASLDAPGAAQMPHAKALMLSRPYFNRVPDQGAIVGQVGEGETHIGATRDRAGNYLMVYLPQGQPVTVDMTKLSGASAIGWWFDPRTGAASRIDGTFLTNQHHRFSPPSSGMDQDWVLIFDDAAKNYPPPGSNKP